MALVCAVTVPKKGKSMLRLVLLLLYLMASSSMSPQTKQGGGIDPLGLNTPPPPPQTQPDQGGGINPLG